MQRMSVETHLREFSRIQGYQNHPKYQEYLVKFREIVRLQQSLEFSSTSQLQPQQQQQQQQQQPIVPHLQFDQNGLLINSTVMPSGYGVPMQAQIGPISGGIAKELNGNPYDGEDFYHTFILGEGHFNFFKNS